MTKVEIFAIYSQFLGEFTVFQNNLLLYSPMCESSVTLYLIFDHLSYFIILIWSDDRNTCIRLK